MFHLGDTTSRKRASAPERSGKMICTARAALRQGSTQQCAVPWTAVLSCYMLCLDIDTPCSASHLVDDLIRYTACIGACAAAHQVPQVQLSHLQPADIRGGHTSCRSRGGRQQRQQVSSRAEQAPHPSHALIQ